MFFKFVEMPRFLTICYFMKFLHTIMVLKMQKKVLLFKNYVIIVLYQQCQSNKKP
jgi:hypothetical protein